MLFPPDENALFAAGCGGGREKRREMNRNAVRLSDGCAFFRKMFFCAAFFIAFCRRFRERSFFSSFCFCAFLRPFRREEGGLGTAERAFRRLLFYVTGHFTANVGSFL